MFYQPNHNLNKPNYIPNYARFPMNQNAVQVTNNNHYQLPVYTVPNNQLKIQAEYSLVQNVQNVQQL